MKRIPRFIGGHLVHRPDVKQNGMSQDPWDIPIFVCNLFSYSQFLQPGANRAGIALQRDCDLADRNAFVVQI